MHIDAHCHFFNTRYIPVAGVARHFAGLPGAAAAFIDFAVTAITANDRRLDRLPSEGIDAVRPQALGPSEMAPKFTEAVARAGSVDVEPAEAGKSEAVNEFIERLPGEVLQDERFDAFYAATAAGGEGVLPGEAGVLAEPPAGTRDRREFLRRYLDSGSDAGIRAGVAPAAAPSRGGVGVGGMLQFVLNLVSREMTLYEQLRDSCFGVGLYVHLMMDMETAYGDRCDYTYARAIRRVREMCRRSRGHIVPFVAFDPYRPDGLAIVERALHTGFVGVKFYPPTGYRAVGNERSMVPGVTPAELDARSVALLEMCARDGIPIIAHCTPQGMERDPCHCSGYNADPAYWETVLKDPRFAGLRLCLAHAGGHRHWFPDVGAIVGAEEDCETCPQPEPAWALRICEMCSRYEHVYTDLSHMGEILTQAGAGALRASLEETIGGDRRLGEKMMYGSDFPMPLPWKGWRRYYTTMRGIVGESEILREHEAHLFFENARAFLNLGGYVRRNADVLEDVEKRHLEMYV